MDLYFFHQGHILAPPSRHHRLSLDANCCTRQLPKLREHCLSGAHPPMLLNRLLWTIRPAVSVVLHLAPQTSLPRTATETVLSPWT